MVKAADPRIAEGNDEGRGCRTCATDEAGLIVGDEEADDGEGGDVDDGDTPEGTFDGTRHRLTGIGGFGRSQSNQFGAGCKVFTSATIVAIDWRTGSPKAKAAVTKTAQTPLKPWAKAPGFCHMRPPIYSLYCPLEGPPPQMQTLAHNEP